MRDLIALLRRLLATRLMAGDDAPVRLQTNRIGPEPEPPMPDDDRPGLA